MSLFGSLIDLVSDITSVAVAPIEIAVGATRAAVKPIAEVTQEVVEDIKQDLDLEE